MSDTSTETSTGETGTESSDDDYAQQQLSEASGNEQGGESSGEGGTPKQEDKGADEAARWKALSRKNEADLKAAQKRLREIEDKDKSEAQKLTDQLNEREVELSELRVAMVRREAAEAANLPASFVKFISAAEPDEALAQAKELAKALKTEDGDGEKPPPRQAADLRQGARTNSSAAKPANNNDLFRQYASGMGR